MKNIKIILLALVLAFTFAACGDNTSKEQNDSKPADNKNVEQNKKEETNKDNAENKESKENEETDKKNAENDNENKELKTIKVASHVSPMIDILELIKEDLESIGYKLEIVKVSDNVQANVALANKEVDANFFQHELFMQMYNDKNKANLVAVQPIYNAIVAFYGKDIKSVKDIKDNATVAVPSDPTNMTRALRILAANNLITLKDPESYSVKIEDIKDNPMKLNIMGVSLLNLNEAYNEKDLVFNYPAYISKIGLTPMKNGLLIEDTDDKFAISLVAREDNKDSEEIQALIRALTMDKVKNMINTELEGHALVCF